jgi:hypothetical protein
MAEPRSREGDRPVGLRVERVDVVPTDLGTVVVRVAGRWDRAPIAGTPLLVVPTSTGERRFEPLPETSEAAARAAPEGAFRAAFSVPDRLRPALSGELRLELSGAGLPLPPVTDAPPAAPAGAAVIDRAVLAERRARRAELAQETQARRADEAEGTQAALEAELGRLELQLERATAERAELESRLAEADDRTAPLRARALAARREATIRAERELAGRTLGMVARPPLEPVAIDAAQALRLLDAEARMSLARGRPPGEAPALRDEVRRAAEAVAGAGWSLTEAREAVGVAAAALAREREARARQGEVQARAERTIAEMQEQIAELQMVAEKARRAREAEEAMREISAAAGRALEEAEARIGVAHEAAAGMQERFDRELGETTAQLRAEHEDELARLRAEHAAEIAAQGRLAASTPEAAAPWLPHALRRLAVADPGRAVRLGLQLLPGQALASETDLDYDLEVPGPGWHAVALDDGRGRVVPMEKPRKRRRSDFRISLDPPAFAELLAAGGSLSLGKAGRVRLRGTLRRRRALRSLPPGELDLARLAAAGIWPEPGLVLAALAQLVEPEWTAGDPFAVALEVVGPRGGRWGIRVPGGAHLDVAPGDPAFATVRVRTSQAAFQHLLADTPPGPAEDKAQIRGDVNALARLMRWFERARREAR